MEIRAHIRAPLAASPAGKPRLQIRQPNVIGPLVAADRRPVRAMIIGAIDQEATNARGVHFGEGDFLAAGEGGHDP